MQTRLVGSILLATAGPQRVAQLQGSLTHLRMQQGTSHWMATELVPHKEVIGLVGP